MKYLEAKQRLGGISNKMLPGPAATKREPAPGVEATPRLSAAARRLAAELGLDLSTLTGTGTDGQVTVIDVRRAAGMA